MQYQLILFFVNMSFLALISFVFRLTVPKQLFLVFSTIYSYILAALLPFLLLWLSPQQTILFYVLAIGLVFVVILYRNNRAEKAPTNSEENLSIFQQIKLLLPKVNQINDQLIPRTESVESNQVSEIHIEETNTIESGTNFEGLIIEPDKSEEISTEEIKSSAATEVQEKSLDQPKAIIEAVIPMEVRTIEATAVEGDKDIIYQNAEPVIQDDNELSGTAEIQMDEILPDVEPAAILEETVALGTEIEIVDITEIEESDQIIPSEDDQTSIEPSIDDEAKDLPLEVEIADNIQIGESVQVIPSKDDQTSIEPPIDDEAKALPIEIEIADNIQIEESEQIIPSKDDQTSIEPPIDDEAKDLPIEIEIAGITEIEESEQLIPSKDDQTSIEPPIDDGAKDLPIEVEIVDNIEIEVPDQVNITGNDQILDESVQDIPDMIELQAHPEIINIEDEDIGKTDHEPINIEQLIIEAFEAKFNDDYSKALEIFVKILEQEPPEEITHLILDDVEILFAKLAS